MRLTLRTLLAYLDNTLQPADAEKLRQKLTDSGFATTLVRRIRATLSQSDLSAASPDAIGPIEDANLTSEYLDSTLPPEQVAEIERAALDSDSQLAETAACHQILTMVLGRPANVSSELRDRIYQLPERELGEISSRLPASPSEGSFSALTIDAELPTSSLADESLGSELDSDNVLTAPAQRAIEPVGKTDSGVTDAPSRLQQHSSAANVSRPRRIDDNMIGSGPSRMRQVVPLLVSLAVCAVLLFALSRVFQPLLTSDIALEESSLQTQGLPPLPTPSDPDTELIPPPQPELPLDELPSGLIPAPAMEEDDVTLIETLPMPVPDSASSDSGDFERMPPAPEAMPAPIADALPEASATDAGEDPMVDDLAPPIPMVAASDLLTMPEPAMDGEGSSEPISKDASDAKVAALMPSDPSPTSEGTAMEATAVETTAMEDPTLEPGMVPAPSPDNLESPVMDEADVAGKLVGSPTLLMRLADRQWQRIKTDEGIVSDQFIVAAPTFRTTISVADRFDVTLLGPAAGRLIKDEDLTIVRIDFGRAIINAKADGVDIPVLLGDQLVGLNLDNSKTTAALSVTHRRLPGADPLDESNQTTQISLLAVEGNIDSAREAASPTADAETKTISAGQGWTRIDSGDYTDLTLSQMPAWVLPVDEKSDKSLDATARSGLLALLPDDQPFDQSLREATLFRRAEVVDLAAETLLAIGQAETYFGGDGILNDPKQRIYWSKHFEALVTTINRNPIFAKAVLSDARRMDSANGDAITKLLTGYSQSDLETGGDRELVEMLQNPSMTIRALAIANLKAITGSTLLYRADYDTEARRNAGVKKWVARLRKGDIRWPEKKRVEKAKPTTKPGTADGNPRADSERKPDPPKKPDSAENTVTTELPGREDAADSVAPPKPAP